VTYQESLTWLYGTQLHGIKLGLDTIQRLTSALGIDLKGQVGPKFIHVAGTNGKGSVCAFLDSILRTAGKKVGLFTSPHLICFRERIKVDGEMISEAHVASGLTAIRKLITGWEYTPTFFEITTALALAYFQMRGVEIAVLETGLGGRLDATNMVTPLVSVITPIYFDHQQWLGETLPEIALEKAGIIKPGVPIVTCWQREEVIEVLAHIAIHRDAPFHMVMSPLHHVELGLAGRYQRWNAALAVHTLSVAFPGMDSATIATGLKNVVWPGRFQRIEENLVLDGAHNPAASRRLVETWRETFGERKASIILGLVKDKDATGIWEALSPIAARVFAVPVRSPRTCEVQEIHSVVQSANPELSCTTCDNVEAALAGAGTYSDPILITGSLFLVGEALALMEEREEPMLTAQ
jgi:dihydrofolate synthase / folylpolyglutamate synthase